VSEAYCLTGYGIIYRIEGIAAKNVSPIHIDPVNFESKIN
jgi:hypothetical protein